MSRAGGLPNVAKLVTYVQQTAAAPLIRGRGEAQGGQRGGGCSASLLHHLSSHREWVRIYVTSNHELRIYHLCSEVR